jgi:hypothetical protein
MRQWFLFLLVVCCACGSPNGKTDKTVIGPTVADPIPARTPALEKPPTAVTGAFTPNRAPFYAYIKNIDTSTSSTIIGFEDEVYPQISVPKTVGGSLHILMLSGYDREVLLLRAHLKDKNFYKYFPFVLKENRWIALTNGFAVHKSNRPDTIAHILKNNPEVPDEVIRYYSVFDLDATSETGFTWRLLSESIPINKDQN